MSRTVEATLDLEVELDLRGTFQPGYAATGPSYASGGEPGQGDMIEDAEVTGLFVERVKRTRYGLPEYTNMVPNTPGAFTQKVYERVDLLAGLPEEVRKQVLAALSEALRHEAEDHLLDEAGDA